MRIGVLSDTHIPERMRELPPRVLELFSNVEIVLHAGDICRLEVLQSLQEHVSLTFAVYGEGDPPEVKKFLQETHVLEFGGLRVGLMHGHNLQGAGWWDRLRGTLNPQQRQKELRDALLRKLPNMDAIVYGHTHEPFARTVEGVFLFNPGSPMPAARSGPSVGLLEITNRAIRGRIIRL